MTTVSLSSTSIEISFYPPLAIDQNGPISSYNLSFTGKPYNTVTQYKAITMANPIYPAVDSVSINITGLEEYNNYTLILRVINSAGFIDLNIHPNVKTDISGIIFDSCKVYVHTCERIFMIPHSTRTTTQPKQPECHCYLFLCIILSTFWHQSKRTNHLLHYDISRRVIQYNTIYFYCIS